MLNQFRDSTAPKAGASLGGLRSNKRKVDLTPYTAFKKPHNNTACGELTDNADQLRIRRGPRRSERYVQYEQIRNGANANVEGNKAVKGR